MKKIIRLAWLEVRTMFYSPVAWLLLILFLVQCSLTFVDSVHTFMMMQKLSKLYPLPLDPATYAVMVKPPFGVFATIAGKVYLYMPLLTMGLISREVGSGTIRLLYSSPLRMGQIVLGKFGAMVIYSLLFVAVLALSSVAAAWAIPFADKGMLLSGLLGFFLLLCTYSAIGLFMSCLTSYQVVAAISTLAVFAALQYVGNIGQSIDFVRDLTWFLALGSRAQDLFGGMITSRDILYFLIITALFLGFSVLRLRTDQESRAVGVRITRYAGLLALAVGLGYITSRPSLTGYWDTTEPKSNTLAPASQVMLQSTGNDSLTLTAYVNLLDTRYGSISPQARNSYLRLWERYTRFKPMIFHYVYFYDTTASTSRMIEKFYPGKTVKEVAQEYARTSGIGLDKFLGPAQAHLIPGLKAEEGRTVLQLRYKGRQTFLRMYDDAQMWPAEDQFDAALKQLMASGSGAKMGVLEGQLERHVSGQGDREYTILTHQRSSRLSMINNGWDTYIIPDGQEIPRDLDVLIIADPKIAFSPAAMDRLQRYIAGGGNLLVTTEPGKQDIVNPLLRPLGVQVKNGVLVQENKEEVPEMIQPGLTETAANMSQHAAQIYYNGITPPLAGAAALDYNTGSRDSTGGFEAHPLLILNGERGWLKMGRLADDSAAVQFEAKDGDEHGNFVPAIGLTRMAGGRQQRIAVIGDADLMSNLSMTQQKRMRGDYAFSAGLFKWFSGGAMPVELSRQENKDKILGITDEQLSLVTVVGVWVLPAVVLAIGTILLFRRRRK